MSSTSPPPAPPEETRCSVAIFRGESVLLVRRSENGVITWKLPGGHVRDGEDMSSTGRRELREETGLTAGRMHCALLLNTYDGDTGRRVAEIVLYPDEEITGDPRLCEAGLVPQFVPVEELAGLSLRPNIADALRDIRHLHLSEITGENPGPVVLYERQPDE
ncbi:NUDIX hydrolase [Streptomyces sp. 8L]|uniref:NUDIX hydrolase n=1 Tax=Streptomyces sp. 8L TaxID=2877242 RepID=UPI001CD5B343|nr:NUDIX domain-containing protein [Streptomyces sp. 8L]MCA1218075.1 NUDIX domain-containing protein [Streptomyces sp. 8L]